MKELTIKLHDESFNEFHKCGLSGLYLSLIALEKKYGTNKINTGEWSYDNYSVTLKWNDKFKDFFNELKQECFMLDENNVLYLNSFDLFNISYEAKIIFHECIMKTIFTNGEHKDIFKFRDKVTINIDDFDFCYNFSSISQYAFQKVEIDLGKKEDINKWHKANNWKIPGCDMYLHKIEKTAKHLEQRTDQLLCDLFLLNSMYCYKIIQHNQENKKTTTSFNYCLIIPKIKNLKDSYNLRKIYFNSSNNSFNVSCIDEAILKLVSKSGISISKVLNYGSLPWVKKNQTSINISYNSLQLKNINDQSIKLFKICQHVFPVGFIKKNLKIGDEINVDSTAFPILTKLFYKNLVGGRKIYYGFNDFINENKKSIENNPYEIRGLNKMCEELKKINNKEEFFIVQDICHQILSNFKAKNYFYYHEKGRDQNYINNKFDVEYENIRDMFSYDCPSQATFVHKFMEFCNKSSIGYKFKEQKYMDVISNIISGENNWRSYKDMVIASIWTFDRYTISKKSDNNTNELTPEIENSNLETN